MLDDVPVLYYNGDTKTFITRGNTTAEDDVFDLNVLLTINGHMQSSFMDRWVLATRDLNKTDSKYCSTLAHSENVPIYTILESAKYVPEDKVFTDFVFMNMAEVAVYDF